MKIESVLEGCIILCARTRETSIMISTSQRRIISERGQRCIGHVVRGLALCSNHTARTRCIARHRVHGTNAVGISFVAIIDTPVISRLPGMEYKYFRVYYCCVHLDRVRCLSTWRRDLFRPIGLLSVNVSTIFFETVSIARHDSCAPCTVHESTRLRGSSE